ncbi:MAG: TolC family protein [Myxococcaceae bacterium]
MLAVRAQELTISSVRGNYFPAIGVSAGVTDNGRALTALTWNMNAGATLSWNLFAGLETNAQVREASANLANLRAQVDLLRQQVRLDISQAQLAVQAARERLRLSEGRYQTGVGNVIELGDAQVTVTSAAAQSVQAEYRLAAARAQLLLSLGQET